MRAKRDLLIIHRLKPSFSLPANAVGDSGIRIKMRGEGLEWREMRVSSAESVSLQQAVNQLFLKLK